MTTWPGKEFGVRPPLRGEVPLSADEVLVLVNIMMRRNSYLFDLRVNADREKNE